MPVPYSAASDVLDEYRRKREDREMREALRADGEKLRQLTGEDHGPMCPRCLVKPLGRAPVFLGSMSEGHICDDCWAKDRAAEFETG